MTLPPDYELALLHMPAEVRPAMEAMFSVDEAMAEVVARSTDLTLGRIKLAWWREQLQALDHRSPPTEPRLRAITDNLLPVGISGADVAQLEAGWATLLDQQPDPALVARSGARLFELGGRLLGAEDAMLADAGALFALNRASFAEQARNGLERLREHRFVGILRPLTMLARGAAEDLRNRSDRARLMAMLAHRWSGRIA